MVIGVGAAVDVIDLLSGAVLVVVSTGGSVVVLVNVVLSAGGASVVLLLVEKRYCCRYMSVSPLGATAVLLVVAVDSREVKLEVVIEASKDVDDEAEDLVIETGKAVDEVDDQGLQRLAQAAGASITGKRANPGRMIPAGTIKMV
ncbi:hypothetical protein V8F33_013044 [Rhypophila sp. PSN 637]